MSKKSHDDLISQLALKQQAIENRIASLKARKRKDEERVLTRKKILLGAYLLEKFKDKEAELQNIVKEMDTFLTRPLDRKLFGLPVSAE